MNEPQLFISISPPMDGFSPPFLQVILNDAVVDILAPVGPGSGLNLGAHLLGLWECENPTLQENAGCPPRCWPQFKEMHKEQGPLGPHILFLGAVGALGLPPTF